MHLSSDAGSSHCKRLSVKANSNDDIARHTGRDAPAGWISDETLLIDGEEAGVGLGRTLTDPSRDVEHRHCTVLRLHTVTDYI